MSVGGSHSELLSLNTLKTRYPCFHDPLTLPAAAFDPTLDDDDNRYLPSLWVFGPRQVDGPESPLPSSFSNMMFDQSIIDPHLIREKITSALKVLRFRERHVLVQFWSPVSVRNRWLLTTWDQPFGVGMADEGLYLHRRKSELRAIIVDGEFKEELGPPGRVYSQKLPEWSLDINDGNSCYDIYGYIDLPVFQSSGDSCVGVLEIITSSSYVDYAFEVQEISRALKKQNLKSPIAFEDPSFYVADERRQRELDRIFGALKTVCDSECLPLAQTWALSGYSSSVARSGILEQSCSSFNKCCIGKVCMSSAELPFYVRDLSKWGFREACRERHLQKSQGVAGRSLSSCGTCFCRNVTELDEEDYPLVPSARISGLASCIAIYLKSLELNAEYVIEFYLPTISANASGIKRLMKLVKQQFKSPFWMEVNVKFPLQVIGGVPLDWNHESPPSRITLLTGKGKVQPDTEVMAKDDNVENKPSNSGASAVPSREKGIDNFDNNAGNTQRIQSHLSKGSTRKRKRSESLFTSKEIKKHFGKTMDQAAADLKVSRSTLKRICRNLGIARWPYRNGLDMSDPLTKIDETDVAVHKSEGAITPVFEASNEPLGNDQATLTKNGIQTTMPNEAEPTNMIIKVTYDKNTIKFPFNTLDGLLKLNEMVATRFQLKLGSFRLKYVYRNGENIMITYVEDLAAILDPSIYVDSKPVVKLYVHMVPDQCPDS
uniref:protein NLP6-like n=1 Tax=Erigeron canadensis TaxID=72917 RepID=UPI001CB8E35F|nr:protein NLP6-like [Erigeron canadensis]